MDDDRDDDKAWAARYRQSASEARERAATVHSEAVRKALSELAAEYEALAAERERRLAGRDLGDRG